MQKRISRALGHCARVCSIAAAAWLASPGARALEPRKSAREYPHHCQIAGGTIGADFLSRSLPTPRGSQVLPAVLVFEVGLFPSPGNSLSGGSSSFLLDRKGQKAPAMPLAPEFVAAVLRRPDWEYARSPQLVLGGGRTNRDGTFEGVTIGGPPQVPRFPGDNRPIPQRPEPEIPGAPAKPNPVAHDDETPGRIVVYDALPRGEAASATAGYLYFPYGGKLKKLKRVTLTYLNGGTACEMAIRP
jgi:hypothetical protein